MNKEQFKTICELIKEHIKDTEWADKVFYVGGCIRDCMLQRPIKDIDICVSKPNGGIEFAEYLTKKLGIYKEGTNPVIFPQFGTAKFTLKSALPQLGDIEIETVQTRKEAYRDDKGRKPEVCFGTLKEDALRRDLTINALYGKAIDWFIHDISGLGHEDLKNHILRTPQDADIAFKDDALRILRVIRFSCTLGWGIERKTWIGMCKNVQRLSMISKERIQQEFNAIITSEHAAEGIRKLYWCGALKYIVPELIRLVGLNQGKHHCDDAFDHTLAVLSKVEPKVENRLAALLHDIGKYGKWNADLFGNVHFPNHEDTSMLMTMDILEDLKYPNATIAKVKHAVANHMRFKQSKNPSNHAIRKFVNEIGDDLDLTLDLIEADNMSHAPKSCIKGQVALIRKRIEALKEKEDTIKVHLPVNGKDIMKEFNLPKGPTIGAALKLLTEYAYIKPKMTKGEAMQIVKEALEKETI